MEEDTLKLEETLPFSAPKQQALLGYALTNDRFFDQIKGQVKPNWFVGPRESQVYNALLVESASVHRRLKPDELKECFVFMHVEQAERSKLSDAINMAIAQTDHYGLDVLVPELSDWLKARVYMEQVYKSRDLFNSSRSALDSPASQKRREEAYGVLREMGRTIDDISFDKDGEVTFEDIPKDLVIYESNYKNAMTFGSTTLDRVLLPEANGRGSLLPGDMTILMGAVNAGKTSAMITTLAANLKAGRNALLIAHEGRVDDLKLKLIQCVLGLTKKELFYYGQDPNCKEKFEQVSQLFKEHLVYHPMIRAGLTVEDLGAVVRKEIDKFAAKHNGAKIDLVVDDYLARLTSVQNGKGQLQKRERDQVVYEYGATLAGECDVHLLTALQVNREGNKVNKKLKGADDRLLTPEDASESYGPCMVATNIITLNRSPLAQIKNRVTFLVCKSRSSETNIAVVCGSKYSCCITHNDQLGSTSYRGLSPMEERIDELLETYKNGTIPDLLVYKTDGE